MWSLSYLGAELPKGSFDKNVTWIDERTFRLNITALGFNDKALSALRVITDSLKQTQVYKKLNALELGHFIAITIGSSWHYYHITDAPATFDELVREHQSPVLEVFPLTRSAIAKHHRMLKVSCHDSLVTQSLFIAEEGPGDVKKGSFVKKELEVIDVMKNGQLRAMIYDINSGRLITGGDPSFSGAGKPAKCLWCHEIRIPNLLANSDTIPYFMSPADFRTKIDAQNILLKKYRETLNSDIDFTKVQDHTYQEIAYISFMEPSLERLSQEWKIPVSKLKTMLAQKPRHIHHEFKYLGELVQRQEIEDSAVYNPGKLPGSIREDSDSEPDYFKSSAR